MPCCSTHPLLLSWLWLGEWEEERAGFGAHPTPLPVPGLGSPWKVPGAASFMGASVAPGTVRRQEYHVLCALHLSAPDPRLSRDPACAQGLGGWVQGCRPSEKEPGDTWRAGSYVCSQEVDTPPLSQEHPPRAGSPSERKGLPGQVSHGAAPTWSHPTQNICSTMIDHLCRNPTKSKKELLESVCEFSRVEERRSKCRNQLYSCTRGMNTCKLKFKNTIYKRIKHREYSEINLTKGVQDLYSENDKTLPRENLKNLNKWGVRQCSWTGKISVVKTAIVPKL